MLSGNFARPLLTKGMMQPYQCRQRGSGHYGTLQCRGVSICHSPLTNLGRRRIPRIEEVGERARGHLGAAVGMADQGATRAAHSAPERASEACRPDVGRHFARSLGTRCRHRSSDLRTLHDNRAALRTVRYMASRKYVSKDLAVGIMSCAVPRMWTSRSLLPGPRSRFRPHSARRVRRRRSPRTHQRVVAPSW